MAVTPKNTEAIIQNAGVAITEKKNPSTIKDYIKAMESEIKKALPKVITPERFTRIALSAISQTPQLQNCTPQSFLAALMNCAQLGLEPNTPLGQAYLIPFKNTKKGVVECQFQLGYKGLIDIAYRSGELASIEARVVYANDDFEVQLGLDSALKHSPKMDGNRGEAIAVYGIFKLANGGYYFDVMSIDDVKAHAQKYSQAYKSGFSPWNTNFEEMAKKTIIKKVLKYAPLRTDVLRQVSEDGTVKTELDEDMSYVKPDYFEDAEYTEVEEG
jgi:recombination protein RecT